MSLTFEEIEQSKVKTKFYSELQDKIITRSQLLKDIQYDWHRISDEDNYNELVLNHSIPCDLEKLESKSFRRWDEFESRMRLHKGECENSDCSHCACWCGDLYHGLHYQRLPNERVEN